MKTLKFLICITLVICALLCSCSNPLGERTYREDLYINIPDTDYQLLIKEWSYLLGSGSEVYFVDPSKKKPVHLENIPGGDDGYCPFNDGNYSISYSNGTVTLYWSMHGSIKEHTRNASFDLPID